jgi:hypothetical protein
MSQSLSWGITDEESACFGKNKGFTPLFLPVSGTGYSSLSLI